MKTPLTVNGTPIVTLPCKDREPTLLSLTFSPSLSPFFSYFFGFFFFFGSGEKRNVLLTLKSSVYQ